MAVRLAAIILARAAGEGGEKRDVLESGHVRKLACHPVALHKDDAARALARRAAALPRIHGCALRDFRRLRRVGCLAAMETSRGPVADELCDRLCRDDGGVRLGRFPTRAARPLTE